MFVMAEKNMGARWCGGEADGNFILSWICKQDKEIPTHMYERSLIHLCIPLEVIKSLFSRAGVITLHPSYYWVAQYTIPHHSSQARQQSRSQSNLTVIKAEVSRAYLYTDIHESLTLRKKHKVWSYSNLLHCHKKREISDVYLYNDFDLIQ